MILLLISVTYNAYAEKSKFFDEYVNLLGTKDSEKIELKIREFRYETDILSFYLKKLIKTEKDPYRKALLIYLAGRLKLDDVTQVLISNLDFAYRDPNASSVRMFRWFYFPSVDALSRIGMGSVKELVDDVTMGNHKHPDMLVLLAIRWTIRNNIKNVDSVLFTKLILEGAYKDEDDPKGKENLKKAIDLISQENYIKLEDEFRQNATSKAVDEYKKQQKNEVKPVPPIQ